MSKEERGGQQRVPIEYMLLVLLICLSIEPSSEDAWNDRHTPQSTSSLLQCDARAGALLTLAPAFCPAAAAVTSVRKLELANPDNLTWHEAKELLTYLPFVLFRFPDHKGAGLLAILASYFDNGPKAPTPKDSLAIPTTNNSNPTSATTATSTHLAVKNRFARSFSQLVASQLVPGDLITMAKSQGILTNMGVDYVVVFRFATTGQSVVGTLSRSPTNKHLQQTRKRLPNASRTSPRLLHQSVLLQKSATAKTTPYWSSARSLAKSTCSARSTAVASVTGCTVSALQHQRKRFGVLWSASH